MQAMFPINLLIYSSLGHDWGSLWVSLGTLFSSRVFGHQIVDFSQQKIVAYQELFCGPGLTLPESSSKHDEAFEDGMRKYEKEQV